MASSSPHLGYSSGKPCNPDLHHTVAIRIVFNFVFCTLLFFPHLCVEPRLPSAVYGFTLPEGTGLPEQLHLHPNKEF
jgi:hypothetical protein